MRFPMYSPKEMKAQSSGHPCLQVTFIFFKPIPQSSYVDQVGARWSKEDLQQFDVVIKHPNKHGQVQW